MEYYDAALILAVLSLFVQKTVICFKKVNDNDFYPKLSKSCPKDGSMVIKGYDVRLSDFVRTNGDIYNLCSNKIKLKVIKVFALNALVIDRDVDVAGSHLKLFVVAPKWLVIGDRRIAVDGTIGKYMPRANGGNSENTTGADGEPGDPGGPGGNFFGIGETFINGNRLVITANGGIGGTGQYGGHGYDQQIAWYADRRSIGKISCQQCYFKCNEDVNHKLNLEDNLGDYRNFTCNGSIEEKGKRSCSCKIFGWEGEDGGKGGNGGTGGIGGLPGSVKLVALNNDSHVSTYSIPGKRGMNGEGGNGGKSGQNGHNIIYTDLYIYPSKLELEKGQITFYRLGPNGSDGYNSVGSIEDPVAPDVLESLEIANVLTEHKNWLREISGLVMNDKALVLFYRNLYNTSVLTGLYNVLKEIQDIDEQYLKLRRYVLLSIHESALGRVYGFAESFVNNTSSDQNRYRGLFYTDLLVSINNFTQLSHTFIAVNISEFFESEEMNINKINDMVSHNKLVSVVSNKFNNNKENYRNPIDKLTRESRWFLKNKINIATNKIVYDVAKTINELISTIVKAKIQQKKNELKILMWVKELQGLLITNSYLTTIKLLQDFFNILYEFAEIVSSVVDVKANVTRLLFIEKKNETQSVVLPELLIHKLNHSIDAFKSKEVTLINELLKNILIKTRSSPEILTDVSEKLLNVQLRLKNTNRLYAINALRSGLLKVLKIKMNELSDYIGVHNYNEPSKMFKSHLAHSMLHRIINLVTLSLGFIDLYNKYSNNKSNLNTIIECIITPDHLLRVTLQYENSIYGMIYPLLQSIQDLIRDILKNREQLSKLIFAFLKQEFRFGLLRIQQNIRQLAEISTNRKVVIGILKELGGVCTALIAIFDRLQNYLHLSQLENLIAEASVPVKVGTIFTDVLISNDFEFINNHLSSDLVLKHYKNAVDTFKNFVFPMAQVYLKDIILPEHFTIYDTFNNIYSTAKTQMGKMLEKVEQYKTLVLAGDKFVSRKDFGSRLDHPSEPFFVWRNDQYKDAIMKLLSGEKVLFDANITKSTLTENAIKLNSIEFYFKAKNKKMQQTIDSLMEYFWIEAKHFGSSQYRYCDLIFLTTSESFSFVYSFVKDKHGERLTTAGSYWYMRNATIMLSPYALWEIHIDKPENIFFSHKDLLAFKDDLDLELGGNGYYISKEKVDKNDSTRVIF